MTEKRVFCIKLGEEEINTIIHKSIVKQTKPRTLIREWVEYGIQCNFQRTIIPKEGVHDRY